MSLEQEHCVESRMATFVSRAAVTQKGYGCVKNIVGDSISAAVHRDGKRPFRLNLWSHVVLGRHPVLHHVGIPLVSPGLAIPDKISSEFFKYFPTYHFFPSRSLSKNNGSTCRSRQGDSVNTNMNTIR